jgi:enoyl-[acyl-carrier protein] reductase I
MSAERAPVFEGKKALLVGIANEHSIAYGCAAAFRELGAELAITYVKERTRKHVEPLARALAAPIFMPLDVGVPGQLEAVFERIERQWGRLDVLVHSISGVPKSDLRGGLLNCSVDGFLHAMDVSCHSFIRMARLAAPLMTNGGTMFAMTYLGANRVVPNYNVMGPVKAALEAVCHYLAYDPPARDLARTAQDACRLGAEGLRPAAQRGDAAGTRGRGGGHHGRGVRVRLSCNALRAAPHRQHHLRRWGVNIMA